jgi:hypothetical protein
MERTVEEAEDSEGKKCEERSQARRAIVVWARAPRKCPHASNLLYGDHNENKEHGRRANESPVKEELKRKIVRLFASGPSGTGIEVAVGSVTEPRMQKGLGRYARPQTRSAVRYEIDEGDTFRFFVQHDAVTQDAFYPVARTWVGELGRESRPKQRRGDCQGDALFPGGVNPHDEKQNE